MKINKIEHLVRGFKMVVGTLVGSWEIETEDAERCECKHMWENYMEYCIKCEQKRLWLVNNNLLNINKTSLESG